ncbi:MAG: carboxypeptidase regulatory-like domain-containing protein [Elusimicrobia bacterium]|nr:carboxypeptidase regulatory-like domain-containing protein [Elusimicrobiota bacterium]
MKSQRFLGGRRGLSLVELMVAVSIISIGVLGFVGSFRFIAHSISDSRARSLASALAQEKVENLKNTPYQKLLISTKTFANPNFAPPTVYDALNYPPETIKVGGIEFTRGVMVSLTRLSGDDIILVSANYPDSGLKFVTVYVMWQQRGEWKMLYLDNIYENPTVTTLNAVLKGVVTTSGGAGIPGTVIEILEKSDWTGTAGTGGSYTFQVYPGTYSVHASSAGHYDSTVSGVVLNDGAITTTDLTLTPIASGTVTGLVYISTNLLISQVSAGSVTFAGDVVVSTVEYVELFNPTSHFFNIAAGSSGTLLAYYDEQSGANKTNADFSWVYVTTYVAPSAYYLMASASWFYLGSGQFGNNAPGRWVRADAYYGTMHSNYIRNDKAGAVRISDAMSGRTYDTVGWDDSDHTAPLYEGRSIQSTCGVQDGLQCGDQVLRISSAPDTLSGGLYGPSYDSNDNRRDFLYRTAVCGAVGPVWAKAPTSTFGSTSTVIAGTPAVGANVTSNDLISPSTVAYLRYYSSAYASRGSLPVAQFILNGVATGTWSMLVSSGGHYSDMGNVTVYSGASTGAANGSTSPTWIMPGWANVYLATPTDGGYIGGLITNAANQPLSGITVIAGGISRTTGANGRYFASVAVGPATVVVNPGNAASAYAEFVALPNISEGELTTQNAILTQAGVLSGFITSDGTSAMPNIEVTATRNGVQFAAAVTDTSGHFYVKNLSTGTYDIKPVLDPLEVVTPSSITVSVLAAQTVAVGTFTVSGAQGKVAGSVTYAGATLTTGALILVSTISLSNLPPQIVASSAAAQGVIYAASSKADGTYEVEVRGSTSTAYRVHAYVPVTGPADVTTTQQVTTGVMVYSTKTTTVNIVIP